MATLLTLHINLVVADKTRRHAQCSRNAPRDESKREQTPKTDSLRRDESACQSASAAQSLVTAESVLEQSRCSAMPDHSQSDGDFVDSIGTTSNHPFWSVDRQEYVQAGQLEIGERLQTLHGHTKTVVSNLPRPGPKTDVYNLEVHAEHVYFVGEDGVLVHNAGLEYSRLRQTPRGKKGHGYWTGSRRGNSNYTSTRGNTAGAVVSYQAGRPKFDSHAKYTLSDVDIKSFVQTYGKKNARYHLHKHADELVAKLLKNNVDGTLIGKFRDKMKFTWHEVDATTMQLVPTQINKNFPHLGGISEAAK